MEVSAKNNINVENAFCNLAADIKKRMESTRQDQQSQQGGAGTVSVGEQNGGLGGLGGKCC